MGDASFAAVSALAGSAIGALASLGSTWLAHNTENRARRLAESKARRENLYGEFIEQASKLYIDAQSHELDEPSKLVTLYALLCKLRLFAPLNVLSRAEEVIRQILSTYSAEKRRDFQTLMRDKPEELDLLRKLSVACREDLKL